MKEMFSGISEHRKAAKHRFDDALALLNASRWRGAMYMAGYSIECLLKTKLMTIFDCHHLVDLEEELQRRKKLAAESTIFTHRLELLLRLTDSLERLRQNTEMWRLFNFVNLWLPAWRYTADLSRRRDAEYFLDAVGKLSKWIEANI